MCYIRETVCVCAYCQWETALKVVLYVSFDNMSDWKGAREKPEGPNITEARAAANNENSQQAQCLRAYEMRCIINAEGVQPLCFEDDVRACARMTHLSVRTVTAS